MFARVLKLLWGFALFFAVFIFSGFLLNEQKSEFSPVTESINEEPIEIEEVVQQKPLENKIIKSEAIISVPLEVIKKEEEVPTFSILTREGIVSWTNFFRMTESLKSLDSDLQLDKIAETKLNDMLLRQYFEHVSPTGEGISGVAKLAGYKFVLIGENLAMGDFKDDEDVTRAWMASPGHRANIMRAGYTRIGVATKKDFLKGRLVWVAVQIFAIPISECPAPEPEVLVKVESNKNQLESLKSHLALLRDAIENEKYETQEQYEGMVKEHNSLVNVYNFLSNATKELIQQYNLGVETFNNCVDNV